MLQTVILVLLIGSPTLRYASSPGESSPSGISYMFRSGFLAQLGLPKQQSGKHN